MPTVKEAGYDIPNVPQMRGVVGAPGMPADAIAFYEDMFRKVSSKTAQWQKLLNDSQLDGEFVAAAELTAFLGKFEGELREILERGRRQGGAVTAIINLTARIQCGYKRPCSFRNLEWVRGRFLRSKPSPDPSRGNAAAALSRKGRGRETHCDLMRRHDLPSLRRTLRTSAAAVLS